MDRFMLYYASAIVIIPAMIFSLICQVMVKSRYRKFANINNSRGLSGAQAAARLLQLNGVNNVRIEVSGNGELSDHFDPRVNVIRLSPDVYHGTSIAAVGIACHEAGHACQYAKNYFPIKIRSAIIPLTNFGSAIGFPLAIFGLMLNFGILVDIGIALYAMVAVFQLITLPVEFNASSRALRCIKDNMLLDESEYKSARSVLTAAALTYVAALITALASLLRLLLIANRRND